MVPTTDLGTFEQNCYFFGSSSSYCWSQASRQCVDLGGRLSVIETKAEFLWIMSIYLANFSSINGFFVDATRNRYGPSTLISAWRGGTPLSAGSGTLFNNLYSSGFWFMYSGCWTGYTNYYSEFYLTPSGNMQDINERWGVRGYLCKKQRSAPKPSTVGYNIGYCFPSLPSGGSCPSGWQQYTPGSEPFCYQSQFSYTYAGDDHFRLCHVIGADLVYIDVSTEYSWLYNTGLMSNSWRNDLNAHRFRYGPAYTYSNGLNVNNFTYIGIGPSGSSLSSAINNDWCGISSCIETLSNVWNPKCCFSIQGVGTNNGVCKRPLCGIQQNSLILQTST